MNNKRYRSNLPICLWVFIQIIILVSSNNRNIHAQGAKLVYNWERTFYGSLNNERKLLFARSFSHSQLHFSDIDGDGDDDLFIGKKNGQIAFFENIGVFDQPQFILKTENIKAWHTELDDNGKEKLVEKNIDVGRYAVPELVDIDDDGDLDLFIGSEEGTLFFYKNNGNSLLPRFEFVTSSYMGLRPGLRIVPRFKDINSDRALDLLIGTHEGNVYLYQNLGTKKDALFCGKFADKSIKTKAAQCITKPKLITNIQPEVDASPTWVDWDHDGDWDIVLGKASGKVSILINKGNIFQGKWQKAWERFLFIDVGGYASPVFYDYNKDGFPELFLGTSTSSIIFYENREIIQTGLKKINGLDVNGWDWSKKPEFLLNKACEILEGVPGCLPQIAGAFQIPTSVEASIPAYSNYLYNINPPRKKEKEVKKKRRNPRIRGKKNTPANQMNTLWLKLQANAPANENQANVPPNPPQANLEDGKTASDQVLKSEKDLAKNITRNRYWLSTRNFLKIGRFLKGVKRTVISSGDWDNDGDIDLMLGCSTGELFAYENIGTAQEANWRAVSDPIFENHQRFYSAPVLTDIDGDDDLDILIGSQNGRIELVRNIGSTNTPKWKISDLYFSGIDVGSYSIPAVWDIDNDQDLDLFVGGGRGSVVYYQNKGNKNKSEFALTSTRFSKKTVEKNASPAFFLWNDDQLPELIIGSKNGKLTLISRPPVDDAPITVLWESVEDDWEQIDTEGYSTPHFVDINGDQKKDMFVGDSEGNLFLWLNKGSQIIEEKEDEPEIVNNSLEPESSEERQIMDEMEEPKMIEEVEEMLVGEEPPMVTETTLNLPFDPIFILITEKFGGLDFGKRAAPAFLDIDNDGDSDLIVGNKDGNLLYYRFEDQGGNPSWTLVTKNFLDYDGGRNATPTFVDLDQDGDKDLAVGNEYGSILFWENRGTPDFNEFASNSSPFIGVTGGRNSSPAFLDLNKDGRLDLLIGNFIGQLVEYIQIPDGNSFYFQRNYRKYLNFDAGIGAVPCFTDLNNDFIIDLIVASDQGRLKSFIPVENKKNPWGWELNSTYFKNQSFPLGPYPVFHDYDKDGDIDLFIGTEKGVIYYYRNDGEPGKQVSQN